jgi:predicted nucleic acid-binding Zn ribbon protein
MYCPNCGKEIPDGSVFCLQCGRDVTSSSHKKPRSGMTALLIGIVVVVLGGALVVGLAVVAYLYNEQMKPDEQAGAPTRRTVSNPIRQPERMSIVDKTFPVGAQQYVYYTIPLKPGMTHVMGHFTAQGGSNDIEVLVLDQEGFTNFSNGHNAKTYYTSDGYVTTGSIDLNLSSGTYYVVFNNARAVLTNKVVTAKIDAEF